MCVYWDFGLVACSSIGFPAHVSTEGLGLIPRHAASSNHVIVDPDVS